jgi:hypothetical protein
MHIHVRRIIYHVRIGRTEGDFFFPLSSYKNV